VVFFYTILMIFILCPSCVWARRIIDRLDCIEAVGDFDFQRQIDSLLNEPVFKVLVQEIEKTGVRRIYIVSGDNWGHVVYSDRVKVTILAAISNTEEMPYKMSLPYEGDGVIFAPSIKDLDPSVRIMLLHECSHLLRRVQGSDVALSFYQLSDYIKRSEDLDSLEIFILDRFVLHELENLDLLRFQIKNVDSESSIYRVSDIVEYVEVRIGQINSLLKRQVNVLEDELVKHHFVASYLSCVMPFELEGGYEDIASVFRAKIISAYSNRLSQDDIFSLIDSVVNPLRDIIKIEGGCPSFESLESIVFLK